MENPVMTISGNCFEHDDESIEFFMLQDIANGVEENNLLFESVPLNLSRKKITKEDYIIKENC